MKVAVMGAGAIGCFYGGLLARAGASVTLVGRAQHVDAIRARGLLLEMGGETHGVAVAGAVTADGVAGAELVLFCVKSGDTEQVGREMAPHLRPDAVVLCLQNGVDNADRLSAVLGRPVVPVAVYVATEMAGPGHVRHHGRGELLIGPTGRDEAILALFAAAGISARVSADAIGALWGKLVVNCAYNALSALTGLPYGRMIRVPGVEAAMRDVVAECTAVAQASGIALPEGILDAVLGLAASMPAQFSSTAQDLRRGRPTEIDHLNGFVVARGEQLGIPTPVNRLLQTLVRAAETAKEG
ncbi:ketopantoate reductase family protein [Roseomonas sp. PWR1]|uniref:2-dehydropantoate 2-reductase n=1 Tax=Roseomonas nitratireducens TaxID=2820810 RepID=A0ABS4AN24_9PROT|nr:ketopantoate reductase family protein [Neoroseomonas nitratireducens]MBP0462768.1 ketopantoate reductase family protein [Neoroseomonas nitratireducens]